ncbi:MAG TPA: metalloregulator ArsR/SmtB family transcription factor [Actinokineospora sp.]|nr:metalloregulator ArsR/SmtB family transcription factor [Actinokineospora sp.]
MRRLRPTGDPDRTKVPPDRTPIGAAVLTPADADRIAGPLKALADPVRLRLLSLVRTSGEACVRDLVRSLGLSQPTVSHHLRILADAGLLDRERRGNWVWYSVQAGRLAEIRELLR